MGVAGGQHEERLERYFLEKVPFPFFGIFAAFARPAGPARARVVRPWAAPCMRTLAREFKRELNTYKEANSSKLGYHSNRKDLIIKLCYP
jgi:hypothetical protein